jgi:hypothetical protein
MKLVNVTICNENATMLQNVLKDRKYIMYNDDEVLQVIECKRNMDLCKIQLVDGSLRFCSKTMISPELQKAHWAERRLETQDGQS